MSRSRLIAINGSGGAYTSITPVSFCRRMEIVEDQSVTPQGLTYQLPDDSFTQAYTVGALSTVILGNTTANQNGAGALVGLPGQNVPAAYNGGTTYNHGDAVLSNDANGNARSWVCILDGTVGITPVTGANWKLSSNYRAADIVLKIKSATVTGTSIRIVEID